MTSIRVWKGYVSADASLVTWVVFDGRRLGGTAYVGEGRSVERTFYRSADGRVVVHEAHLGHWGAGRAYDQAFVRVFGNLDEACESLNITRQHIDPRRRNINSQRINAPDAPTITLEQHLAEIN
jgi:hypothetical protein